MNSVISATTGSVSGAPVRVGKSATFLATAESLLEESRAYLAAGDYSLALEYGYRAALRVAGAVNADSPVIRKRKRLPTSAWEKLALTGAEGKEWAEKLEKFSTLRSRVSTGIVTSPDSVVVRHVVALAEEFYAEVAYGESGRQEVAIPAA